MEGDSSYNNGKSLSKHYVIFSEKDNFCLTKKIKSHKENQEAKKGKYSQMYNLLNLAIHILIS